MVQWGMPIASIWHKFQEAITLEHHKNTLEHLNMNDHPPQILIQFNFTKILAYMISY